MLTISQVKDSSDDEMAPAPVVKKKKPARASAVESLFEDPVKIVVKREKAPVQEPIEIDTDSSIEIVEENLQSKPQAKKKLELNKGKSKQSQNVAPVKGKHSDVKMGSAENDRPKVSKRDRYVLTHHYLMFTLDRMTLFFFSLSDSFRATEEPDKSALVRGWRKIVLEHDPKRAGKSASSATLTAGSSKRTKSSKASTSRTAVNNKVRIKEADNDFLDNSDGAFSERDERFSGERTRAANSPFKGKGKRVSSSVSLHVVFTNSGLQFNSHLSKLTSPQLYNTPLFLQLNRLLLSALLHPR